MTSDIQTSSETGREMAISRLSGESETKFQQRRFLGYRDAFMQEVSRRKKSLSDMIYETNLGLKIAFGAAALTPIAVQAYGHERHLDQS